MDFNGEGLSAWVLSLMVLRTSEGRLARREWAEGDAGLGQVDVEGTRQGRNAKGKTRLRSLTPDGHEPEAFPADRHGCTLTHFASILLAGYD